MIITPKSRDMKLGFRTKKWRAESGSFGACLQKIGHATQQSWPALSFFLCLANGLLARCKMLRDQSYWSKSIGSKIETLEIVGIINDNIIDMTSSTLTSTSSIINHLLHHIIRCLATTKQAIVERMLFINNEDFPDSQVRLTVSIGWGLLNSIINRCFFRSEFHLPWWLRKQHETPPFSTRWAGGIGLPTAPHLVIWSPSQQLPSMAVWVRQKNQVWTVSNIIRSDGRRKRLEKKAKTRKPLSEPPMNQKNKWQKHVKAARFIIFLEKGRSQRDPTTRFPADNVAKWCPGRRRGFRGPWAPPCSVLGIWKNVGIFTNNDEDIMGILWG